MENKRAYRKWSAADLAAALAMRAEGKTLVEIGEAFDRTWRSVQNALFREGGGHRKLALVCADCPKLLNDDSTSGLCKSCWLKRANRDDAYTGKRVSALREVMATSVGSPKLRETARRAAKKRMADPAYVAQLLHTLRTLAHPKSVTPEAIAKRDYKAIGEKVRERKLGHIPLEYRDLYKSLIRSKGLRAREALSAVRSQIRADRDALSPFERQMADLEAKMKRGESVLIVSNDQFRRRAA